MECLKSISEVKISSDNKYVFNGEQSYDSNRKYGLGIGKYQIRNIPNEHPMAILNNDCSDNIIYYGNDKVTLTGNAGISLQNDDGYSFYTGTIHIIVKGDFQKDGSGLSIYCGEHGYMGGENLLQYSETCKDFERPENTIYSLTQTLADLDAEDGTISKVNRSIFLLNSIKKKIYAQKKNLEEILNFTLNNSSTTNDISVDEGDDLLSVAVGNIGTWEQGDGARRMYKGEDNIAIINNPEQKDGSDNTIIGGSKFTKNLIDNFLIDLEKTLLKIIGKRNLDKKIQDKVDNVETTIVDGEKIRINSTGYTEINNLKNGDIIFVDQNDTTIEGVITSTNNTNEVLIKPIAEINKRVSESKIKGNLTAGAKTIRYFKHTATNNNDRNKIQQIK